MEQLLHYVWKHRLFPLAPLATTQGQPVEVIDPGLHNMHAGPDFFNAKVRIDGVMWVGNVEIHERSADWFLHGHDTDAAYNNVVLHVAAGVDAEKLSGLSTESKDWGPGGPKDEKNRSQGALLYNKTYGGYNAVFLSEQSEEVYMTFDEGYEYGLSGDILDTLKEKGVKAMFFITGDFAKSEPELVQRMIDEARGGQPQLEAPQLLRPVGGGGGAGPDAAAQLYEGKL